MEFYSHSRRHRDHILKATLEKDGASLLWGLGLKEQVNGKRFSIQKTRVSVRQGVVWWEEHWAGAEGLTAHGWSALTT